MSRTPSRPRRPDAPRTDVVRPATVMAAADQVPVVCTGCGNEMSAVRRTATTGVCAWCLTERVRAIQTRWTDRYRSPTPWMT